MVGAHRCRFTDAACPLPALQEPHTLNMQCSAPKMECSPEVQREYVTEVGGDRCNCMRWKRACSWAVPEVPQPAAQHMVSQAGHAPFKVADSALH